MLVGELGARCYLERQWGWGAGGDGDGKKGRAEYFNRAKRFHLGNIWKIKVVLWFWKKTKPKRFLHNSIWNLSI